MTELLSEKEEQILFHTLGYEYKPIWNAERREDRNWIALNPVGEDYNLIQTLITKGYMQKSGKGFGQEEVFRATDKALVYVVDLWGKKKKQNKPTRSKRRYQAYLHWCDCYDGTFKDFLDWLKITDDDRLFYPKEVEIVEEYKRRWNI